MARARNIKPGFFTNELLGTADPMVCLTFAGLWCLADKHGILEDRPLRIRAELFPYRESPDVNGYLTELVRLGFILRYQVGDCRYIKVLQFRKHQSPHHTERAKGYPEPTEDNSLIYADNGYATVNSAFSNGALTVSARSDSLIPDSLIPDTRANARSALPRGREESDRVVPPEINQEAWADWEQHRRKRRKPISDRAAREQWAVLSTLTLEQQAECIAVSIRNDWQGLFPNKIGQAAGGMRARSIVHDLTDRSWATK